MTCTIPTQLCTVLCSAFLYACAQAPAPANAVSSMAVTPVETAPEQDCPAYQVPAVTLWRQWEAYGLTVSLLPSNLSERIAAEINRMPPATDWRPDRVLIAEGSGASAIVMEFADGCAWTSGPRPKSVIDALLSRAATGV